MDQKISSLDELTDVAGATDELVIVDKSDTTMGATGTDKRVTPNVLLEDTVHGATSKTTPVDADLVGLIDSEDSNVLKSLTWDNAKETLKTYFDSLATTLTNKTIDADSNTISNISNNELDTTVGELGGAWASWTPTLTNLTLGNGTVDAKYQQIGKTVNFRVVIVLGSTSVMGNAEITLPVPSVDYGTSGERILGQGEAYDLATNSFQGLCAWISTTKVKLYVYLVSGIRIVKSSPSDTSPMTWTTGDEWIIEGTYEAA